MNQKHKPFLITVISTVILFVLNSCVPLGTVPSASGAKKSPRPKVEKKLEYVDKNYEEYVGNVILNSTNIFSPLNSEETISLEFDLLTTDFENLQARYIHCNFDWKPSLLRELQYLNAFNRFDHRSFEYSVNTKSRYIQYFFELERPYISGNYIVALYRRDDPDDVLFTRRLVFYENKVSVDADMIISRVVKDRRSHQQLDFSLQYSGLEAPMPEQNFQTLIIQNKNWSSGVANLRPTNLQPTASRIEWEYFTGENDFPGWNQFRWLDIRTLAVRGISVAQIMNKEKRVEVFQAIDSRHGSQSYRQLINDNNGRFIPGNSDPGETWLEGDYAFVHFSLKSDADVGNVYVTGRFNDWAKNQTNLMRYNAEVGLYEATIRLKQGYYDYRYEVESANYDPWHFEGSHFQSENEYDLLVYYRAPGSINDEVVGLLNLNSVNYF